MPNSIVIHLLYLTQGQKFQGSRTVESLVSAALKELKVKSHTLTSSNFASTMKSKGDKPWLITYCTDNGGDCLDKTACLKLSAILV